MGRSAFESARRSDVARRARAEAARLDAEWQDEQENLLAMATYRPTLDEDNDVGGLSPTAGDPATVAEAVEWAAASCSHLVFLDDAHAWARRASYRQPERLWRALSAMDELAAAWGRGDLPGGFQGPSRARSRLPLPGLPHRPRPLASRVRAQLRGATDHPWSPPGPRTWIPEACCRIYFHLDEAKRLFVVGHVGNHFVEDCRNSPLSITESPHPWSARADRRGHYVMGSELAGTTSLTSKSDTAMSSSQWGQVPPRPVLAMTLWQRSHRCSVAALVPQAPQP